MLNKVLLKLYFLVPKKFKGTIKSMIVKREGGEMYSHTLRSIFKKQFNIQVGYGSYGGCFNEKHIPAGVIFGNYCSIAPDIRIFRANHPTNTFTTHPLLYNPVAGYVKKDQLDRPPLVVGNDVWIGEWAIILPSVKYIGDGAIIGAGSVVTKNVEPYSIVAGNPARPIKKRFDDGTIQKLANGKWWENDRSSLIDKIEALNSMVGYHKN